VQLVELDRLAPRPAAGADDVISTCNDGLCEAGASAPGTGGSSTLV